MTTIPINLYRDIKYSNNPTAAVTSQLQVGYNGNTNGISGTIWLIQPTVAALQTTFEYNINGQDTQMLFNRGMGADRTAQAHNYVRFKASGGGNLTSGTIRCYGIKA